MLMEEEAKEQKNSSFSNLSSLTIFPEICMEKTNDSLGRIYPKRRKGCDQLHKGGTPIHCNATLQNFWEWYASDIFSNVERGIFAEYIVAVGVGDNRIMTEARDGWGPYDLLSSDGIKIEVKSSGYIQDWPQKKNQFQYLALNINLTGT